MWILKAKCVLGGLHISSDSLTQLDVNTLSSTVSDGCEAQYNKNRGLWGLLASSYTDAGTNIYQQYEAATLIKYELCFLSNTASNCQGRLTVEW